jgi:nucleotide-binding universal stress UspA family protein
MLADAQEVAMEKIVVGIDGSAAAQRALDFACDEAQRRGAELHVVHAWSYPYRGRRPGRTEPRELMEQDASHTLQEAVDHAAASGVTVVAHLEERPSVAALIDASTDAALLVVGSHGHGSVIGSLLGSTSQGVAHRATCAVALIRT